jgi:hypothetical protein
MTTMDGHQVASDGGTAADAFGAQHLPLAAKLAERQIPQVLA